MHKLSCLTFKIHVSALLSDAVLFFVLEGVIAALVFYAFAKNLFLMWREKRIGVFPQTTRGSTAMKIFYGAYEAATAILVVIPLTVEAAEGYRIAFAMLNFLAIAYLCFFNPWFRNAMLGWVALVSKIEAQ